MSQSQKKKKERKRHNMSASMDMDYFGLCKVDNESKEGESRAGDKQAWLQLRQFRYKKNF